MLGKDNVITDAESRKIRQIDWKQNSPFFWWTYLPLMVVIDCLYTFGLRTLKHENRCICNWLQIKVFVGFHPLFQISRWLLLWSNSNKDDNNSVMKETETLVLLTHRLACRSSQFSSKKKDNVRLTEEFTR